MMQQLFNGVLALMLTKFALNDIPHALGLAETGVKRERKPSLYTTYHMRCPRTDPFVYGHKYSIELRDEPYGWEYCPMCGYGAKFEEYTKRE